MMERTLIYSTPAIVASVLSTTARAWNLANAHVAGTTAAAPQARNAPSKPG
ncbi:hypothetical protein LMG27952_06531 [Paraburkholderia hiiakae]|uniref:Uncharacterized protein n=1 Tax=Paraburkholderia hiiakae TaxID=1081782 RepID=A0ABN7IB62_9BURK|nr:hypothetical protein LMG27952_06531 [Paraburkholderia hiiakae]